MGGFVGMLNAVGGDYSSAEVKQDGVYWYGVQIKRDSTGNSYTLSYMDSNIDSYKNNYFGFMNKLVDCLEKCLICRHIRRFAD